MHRLELKIPPLGLVVIAGSLMWLGDVYVPALSFRLPFSSIIAWGMGLVGVFVCALGFIEFRRAKTTVNPTKPGSASSLVRTGVYSWTRNPMYLGFLLVLAGWAVSSANAVALLILPVFVFYMNRFQIEPEERALRSIFGEEFTAYCVGVRRWI